MTGALVRASFHDPDGSVFLGDHGVLRALEPRAAARIAAFLATPVCASLVAGGLLPKTRRMPPGDQAQALESRSVTRLEWFEHERLPFINYPHEWTPDQLLDACQLTLDLATTLRDAGWDLKDASARNVVFRGHRPVFVDFGSFEQRNDSTPLWRPSGQLQRHFLLPMLAQLRLGLSTASLMLARPDGLSHEDAHRCLGRAWLTDRQALWLAAVPVWLGRAARSSVPRQRSLDPSVCRSVVDRTLRSLKGRCAALRRRLGRPHSHWAAYEQARPHYSAAQLGVKRDTVERILKRTSPASVLDIGTNGGQYAIMAAAGGCEVVSIDTDVDVLRVARQAAADANAEVLHLLVDFAAPTPALGWNGVECQSFDQRATRRFDLVMALAVMHHVLVAGRIPLGEMIAKLARYTRSHLLIEYVDPSDDMFVDMARQRGSDFADLTAAAFARVLESHFLIEEVVEVIPARRALYLCRLRQA